MATVTQPQLSRSEWKAVVIAFSDAANAMIPGEPGLFRRMLATLTGAELPRPLADKRLEAIRSFVFATRRHQRPACEYAGDLERLGFSRSQIDALALLSA